MNESVHVLQSQPRENLGFDMKYGPNHDPSEISDSESNDERK